MSRMKAMLGMALMMAAMAESTDRSGRATLEGRKQAPAQTWKNKKCKSCSSLSGVGCYKHIYRKPTARACENHTPKK